MPDHTLYAAPLGRVFPRRPDMDDVTYRASRRRLDEMGYETSRFRRVPQFPSQIDQETAPKPGQATGPLLRGQ